jgi:hypothetical protein
MPRNGNIGLHRSIEISEYDEFQNTIIGSDARLFYPCHFKRWHKMIHNLWHVQMTQDEILWSVLVHVLAPLTSCFRAPFPLHLILPSLRPTAKASTSSLTVQKDGPAAGKEKKRSRNFSVDNDKLLVSGWLNVSIDPVHGTDQALGTY